MIDETFVYLDYPFDDYQISNYGRIIGKRGAILKSRKDEYGKYSIVLFQTKDSSVASKKRFQIHHLVAEKFVKSQSNYKYIGIKDGSECDNLADRLLFSDHHPRSGVSNRDLYQNRKVVCKEDNKIYDSIYDLAKILGLSYTHVFRSVKFKHKLRDKHYEIL